MTFVGKILVILIMALSLVFLGVSTVVFTTATNWKVETEKQKVEVGKLQTQLSTAQQLEKDAQGKLEEAKKDHGTAVRNYDNQVAALKADAEKAQGEITQARTALTDAQSNAQLSLQDATARATDANKLRDQLSAVTEQSNKFKIQQTELNNEILNLKRMLTAAENNAKSLREYGARIANFMIKKGFSPSLAANESTQALPPNVEGKVLKVFQNKMVEISLGSNDGLAVGQVLELFRRTPEPEYLGQVRITAVDPKQAVGNVVGTTVNGKQIKEGDDVASQIRSQ